MATYYTTSVSAPFTCNLCHETKTNKAKLKCSSCHGARPICGSCAQSWVSRSATCPWDRTALGSSTSTTPRASTSRPRTSQPRTSQPRTSNHHGAGSSRRHGLDGSSSSSRRHGLDGRPSSSSRRHGLDGRYGS